MSKFLKRLLDYLESILRNKKQNNLPDGSWDFANEKVFDTDAIYSEVFGSIEFGVGASKDWRSFAPPLEIQSFGDCVTFSRLNNAETKAKAKGAKDPDGDDWNFSDVDAAVGSGTSRTGNTLRKVAEWVRKIGVSLEKDIPYTRDWNQRIKLFNEGKNKTKYKLGNNSWVRPPTTNTLKNALEDSPVQIGIGVGNNWRNGGIIKDPGKPGYRFYHAIDLDYIDEEGNFHIEDSYFPQMKVLDKNYNILFAMSFKDLPQNWRGINVGAEKTYKRYIGKLVIRAEVEKGGKGELYRVYETHLRKVKFNITDKQLFDETTNDYWRKAKKFNGISERVFKELEKIAFTMQGVKEPEEEIDIAGILKD